MCEGGREGDGSLLVCVFVYSLEGVCKDFLRRKEEEKKKMLPNQLFYYHAASLLKDAYLHIRQRENSK
jgi:hypothetical protein